MRISLIALHFAEYSCRLAAALAQDHDVQLILSEPNIRAELEEEFDQFLRIPRLEIIVLPHRRSPWGMLAIAFAIARGVKHFEPDVLHSHEDPKDYLVLAISFLRSRYNFVLTVHDPVPHSGDDAMDYHNSRRGIYQRLLRRWCTSAITHGASLRAQLGVNFPLLQNRISIVPHGPLGPFELPNNPPEMGTLLFFGRINEYKGLRYFVDAVIRLRADGYAVKGIIAGRGSDLEPNRETILENDCFELYEEYVPRARVHELFTRAQVIVMPYIDATQSGVAAMAMGFGKPVVATNVGSISEMIVHNSTGILVAPRDSNALANAIQFLITDNPRYQELVSNVRDARLGWQGIARATVEVYARTIRKSKG
ncbi:glycosyltransferase family 4 protein [Piscinibacter sakaiensis]|uniref:glycosyltransferase family 4 protein n=1 Tax=Piscinibacter sakaiensis TaxID=1547922 RepID=UPI003AABD6F1